MPSPEKLNPEIPASPRKTLRDMITFEAGLDTGYGKNAYISLRAAVKAFLSGYDRLKLIAENQQELIAEFSKKVPYYDEYIADRAGDHKSSDETTEIIGAKTNKIRVTLLQIQIDRCNELRERILKVLEGGVKALKKSEDEFENNILKLDKALDGLHGIVKGEIGRSIGLAPEKK